MATNHTLRTMVIGAEFIDPDQTKHGWFDTDSLVNNVKEREGLTRNQVQTFRKKWNALFDTLDFSIDPLTDLDEGYDDEGMRTYANNIQIFEGQKFRLEYVNAYLCHNRQRAIVVNMDYHVELPERPYGYFKTLISGERSYDFKPLLNYHYSASCEFEYRKSDDGTVFELNLKYTVISTPDAR